MKLNQCQATDVIRSYYLSPENSDYLVDKFTNGKSPYTTMGDFMAQARSFQREIPLTLAHELFHFRNDLTAPGLLLIKNLPLDRSLPPTPPRGKRAVDKHTFVSETSLIGITSLLGQVFGYEDEKEGEMIHNVCPVKNREASLSNEGSGVDFKFHVEAAYFNFRPHFLGLFCLRSDEGRQAATTGAEIKEALAMLPAEIVHMLRQPQYRVQAPQSFAKPGEPTPWSEYGAAIRGTQEHPEIWIDLNSMVGKTEKAQDALKRLEKELYSPQILREVYLEPGDLLLVNNRKAVHGRSPFKAKFGVSERWLQRVYIHSDPWAMLANTRERVKLWQ